jgi:hypothetical protein
MIPPTNRDTQRDQTVRGNRESRRNCETAAESRPCGPQRHDIVESRNHLQTPNGRIAKARRKSHRFTAAVSRFPRGRSAPEDLCQSRARQPRHSRTATVEESLLF